MNVHIKLTMDNSLIGALIKSHKLVHMRLTQKEIIVSRVDFND